MTGKSLKKYLHCFLLLAIAQKAHCFEGNIQSLRSVADDLSVVANGLSIYLSNRSTLVPKPPI